MTSLGIQGNHDFFTSIWSYLHTIYEVPMPIVNYDLRAKIDSNSRRWHLKGLIFTGLKGKNLDEPLTLIPLT